MLPYFIWHFTLKRHNEFTLAYNSAKSSSVDNGRGLDRTHAGSDLVFNVVPSADEGSSSLVPTSSKTEKLEF